MSSCAQYFYAYTSTHGLRFDAKPPISPSAHVPPVPRRAGVVIAEWLRKGVMFILWQYMVMFRAHKDKSGHRFRLCCVIWMAALGAITLNMSLKQCALADISNYVYLCSSLIGMPLIAFRLDKHASPEDVPGGSACCLVLGAQMMAVFVFMVAGGSDGCARRSRGRRAARSGVVALDKFSRRYALSNERSGDEELHLDHLRHNAHVRDRPALEASL